MAAGKRESWDTRTLQVCAAKDVITYRDPVEIRVFTSSFSFR
jgi:hypothetical protein